MNNFVKRTLSGFVFIVIIIASILLSQYSFLFVFTIITCFAIHEFHKLTNQQQNVNVNLYAAIIGGVLLFVSSFFYASELTVFPIFVIYGLYILTVFISELFRQKPNPLNNLAYFVLGQIFIALPFSILNFILFVDNWQPIILLALFVTIWVNDSGAYVTGVTFGKHRLFERISPKKSWEGFVGGAVFALLSGYIFSVFIPEISLICWIIFSEIIVVFGTFGDLIESLLKRTVQVKDSGSIIPGHGGILDRFDSMIFAVPIIFIYLIIIFTLSK